jgi:hypothetical protein
MILQGHGWVASVVDGRDQSEEHYEGEKRTMKVFIVIVL